jgi:FKBP-type peptidyl-prolyl cis-trans isomerase
MRINTNLIWIFATAALMTGCKEKSISGKTPGGLAYQVYGGKGGDSVRKGDFIKVHVTQKINDSVYFTSTDKFPIYFAVGESQPYDISEIWTRVREGDSIVAVQMMDTFIKRNPQSVPPEFKNGDRIYTLAKVLAVFKSDSLQQLDKVKEEANFKASEISKIEKYLADKNLKAVKSPSGVYVETLTEGTGDLIKPGQYVSLKYTGTSFSGVKFDSNVDSSFNHTDPLNFTVGRQEMVEGFDEAMTLMMKGTRARIYIPSMLGYKDRPRSPAIKPYEILIFDIEVLDVQNSAPVVPPKGN